MAAAMGLFFLAEASLPWTGIIEHYRERSVEKETLTSVLAEAKRLDLTFPQVAVAHPACAGKPVYWEITAISSSISYAAGRPAWPIVWTNPESLRGSWSTMGTNARTRLLARVAAVNDGAVYLDYVGNP